MYLFDKKFSLSLLLRNVDDKHQGQVHLQLFEM